MKKVKLFLGLALACAFTSCTEGSTKAKDAEMDQFVSDLMAKMTLQEKIGQLNLPVTGDIVTGQAKSSDLAAQLKNGAVGGLFNLKGVERIKDVQRVAVEESRLGIPLIFGMDVIHGYETVFPIPLGLACSWDMEAIKLSAEIAAKEATADGISWTFSPMVDVSRDARWGRMSEGSGEDPFLGSEIAKAMIHGYQGSDLADDKTMLACVKHFALYGAPDAGRDYNTVDMSRVRMFNEYFPPYKAAIEAGVGTVMTSFNDVDGIPASGNKWLMTEVLRNMWGFDGFVVTDYTAIAEMIDHGMGDLQESSAMALKAGTDMDMVSEGFLNTIEKSIKEGKVTENDVNTACRRILEAKYKLGLFQDPYKYCDVNRPANDIFTAENRAKAREIATKSFVLLKNESNILPLAKRGKIALIGPLAHTKANMPGTWSVAAVSERYNTVYESMKQAVGNEAEIIYAKGCNLVYDAELEARATMFGREMRDSRSVEAMRQEALAAARRADVIVCAMGESSEMSGESSSRTNLDMPDAQMDLLKELKKLGKPIVLLNFSGRSTVMTWENENIPAILNVWFGGSEAADAICDVVFGDVVPSGKLVTSMPKNVGQLPLFYNYKNTGRPQDESQWFTKFRSNYLDVDNRPLYPFGYGLSYTTFDYSNMQLSSNTLSTTGTIQVSVDVKNSGNYDADEIVQLYIRDVVCTITRPMKELKGFQRVAIKKGETKTVTFEITAELLKFYNYDIQYVYELGQFDVMVGPNSDELMTQTIELH